MPRNRFFLAMTAFLFIVILPAKADTARVSWPTSSLSPGHTLIQVAGNNVLIANLPDGLVIVDGGKAEHGEQLLDFIDTEFTDKPIKTLFNTHWHPQQTGLNRPLGGRGVPIIAHENTRQWLGAPHYKVWTNERIAPLDVDALPTKTFYQNGQWSVGRHVVEYGYLLQAHTDGDMYVYFPDDNVLAIGGIIRTDRWPEIDWWSAGWFGGLLDGLETLLAIADDETVIVPAHGDPITKQKLQTEYDMYVTVFNRILALLKQSKSPAEAVAAKPTEGFHPNWENADGFTESAFRSLYGHLRGEKRMGLMP